MNKKYLTLGFVIFAAALVLFFSGCVGPSIPPVNNTVKNNTQVNDTGSTLEGVNAVVNANNQFAFDLYSQFKDENKDVNIFFSPYSISVALAMTYEGANGQTAEEMQNVIHIPKDANLRRANFAKIINEINKKDKEYNLSTANALWAQKDFAFLENYTNVVKEYYDGEVINLDFAGESEKSRQIINDWVENQTNNKIKNLIPQGALDASTIFVLTNAVYFKGTWILQFNKNDTRDGDFKTSSGQIVKVPMMKLTGADSIFNYTETEDAQILEMPYAGEDLSMLIILPKENKSENMEGFITPEKLSEWKNMLEERRVDVYIPKLKFETKYFMRQTLIDMGMPSAFNDADFSGMTGQKDLMISEVIHQAFVEVNEEGTEAAAATAVIGVMSVGPNGTTIPIFRADHPFIFIIQQKDTGNILFLGRVSDPSK